MVTHFDDLAIVNIKGLVDEQEKPVFEYITFPFPTVDDLASWNDGESAFKNNFLERFNQKFDKEELRLSSEESINTLKPLEFYKIRYLRWSDKSLICFKSGNSKKKLVFEPEFENGKFNFRELKNTEIQEFRSSIEREKELLFM